MPFFDEGGKAIIPKSKPKEPEPEPTVKTKYFKPKTTSKPKPKTTPPAPTITKSPLSVKETEFKAPSTQTYEIKQQTTQPVSTPQIIKDVTSNITPYERQIVEQRPTTQPVIQTIVPETATYKQPSIVTPVAKSQVIQDVTSGITPFEKQLVDQSPVPTPVEQKQIEESKLAFVKTVTGHGKENIPEIIRDLGPSAEKDYAVTAFKAQTGIISPEEATEKIQSDFEKHLIEGSKPTSIRWMKEHGTFTSDGKEYSWDELKEKHPQLMIDRYGGEFVISDKPIDYTAWAKEQYKDMDPVSAAVRRGSATLLGGFGSIDYAYAGQTGDPTNVKGQQKKLGAIIDKWEYDIIHNIESAGISPGRYFSEQDKASLRLGDKKFGDIVGASVGTIGNIPAVTNVLAPYGMGVGVGAVFKGAFGVSAALANRGFKYSALAVKGTTKATGIGLGAVAVGTVGADVYSTHLQDPDKATQKILTYGTQFASFGIGAKTGSEIDFSKRKPFLADTTASSYYKKPLRTQGEFYSEMARKGLVWDYNQGGWTKLGSKSILETQKVPTVPKRSVTTMTRPKTGLDLHDLYPVYTAPKTGFSLQMKTGLWTGIFSNISTFTVPLTYTMTHTLTKTQPFTFAKMVTPVVPKTGFSLQMKTNLWTNVFSKTKTQTKTKTFTLPMTQTLTKTQPLTKTKTQTYTITQPLTQTQTQTLTLPKTQVQTDVLTLPQTLTLPKTQTLTETLTLPKTQTLTETLTLPQVLTKTQTLTLTKTKLLTSIATPTIFPKIEFFEHKKKKQVDPFKKYSTGYRFRTWKVPSMKEFFKGGF